MPSFEGEEGGERVEVEDGGEESGGAATNLQDGTRVLTVHHAQEMQATIRLELPTNSAVKVSRRKLLANSIHRRFRTAGNNIYTGRV